MTFEKFNSNLHNVFMLEKCILNEPIKIKYGDKFFILSLV